MIVLGISPGLRSLAYCVLVFRDDSPVAEQIDADVNRGGRGKPKNPFELTRFARVHALILDIVLDRNPPAIVVIGPSEPEPPEYLDAVRAMVFSLAVALRIPVVDLAEPKALNSALGVATDRALKIAVSDRVKGRVQTRDRRQWLATAAAVAGAEHQRRLRSGSISDYAPQQSAGAA